MTPDQSWDVLSYVITDSDESKKNMQYQHVMVIMYRNTEYF